MIKKNKILVTGGDGRFASELKKKFKKDKNFIFLNKKKINIINQKNIKKNFEKYKPNIVLHLAALSRPMKLQ